MQAAEPSNKKPIHATFGNHGDNLTELRICSFRQLDCLSRAKYSTLLCVIPDPNFEDICPCACVGAAHAVISRIIVLASTALLLLMSYLAAAKHYQLAAGAVLSSCHAAQPASMAIGWH